MSKCSARACLFLILSALNMDHNIKLIQYFDKFISDTQFCLPVATRKVFHVSNENVAQQAGTGRWTNSFGI